MSDVMLYGVLRMPYEIAMHDHMSCIQYYQRAREAADRLEKAEARLAELDRAPVSTPQQSAQRASVDTLTDEQISAIYRSTFPRGPYLVTPDVHKFARAVLAWGSAGSGATNRLKSDEVKNG